MNNFAENLRKYRLLSRFTMEELGKRARMGKGQISKYESGQQKPGLDHIVFLSEALDITPNALLGIQAMTPPNNQPTPPEGMRFPIMDGGDIKSIPWELIAPHEDQAQRNHYQTLKRLSERGGLSPDEALAVLEDRPWHRMNRETAQEKLGQMLAIPITPTVPATGDTTTDLILCPKCNSDDTVGISDGDKPETDGLFECYKCGHQFKIGDTTNEKGGEQRQELQVATLLNSALAAIGEYLIAFNWHHDETAWDDEDAGQWIDPITHRTHDIDYAFTLQLQRQLLCK